MNMNHGRDHQEREQKIGIGRRRSTLAPDGIEEQMLASGRTHATPPQYVFGANAERRVPGADLDEPEPVADGAEVAPTRKAEERERARHREERKRGRMTAGAGENLRDRREPEVTREDLDEAARLADQEVSAK
jgi:hypothetical protein